MSKDELIESLRTARTHGVRPSAPDANLVGADLVGADLGGANLVGADLVGADLRGANLVGADLVGADLGGAYLVGADLRGASLGGADLVGADLRGANLGGADLGGAYLRGANLRGARRYGIVALGETPSGHTDIHPTPDGWVVTVGCWSGPPDSLRAMIATDEGWPEATGAECARRRPYLLAVLTHADLIVAEFPDLVPALAAKWNTP